MASDGPEPIAATFLPQQTTNHTESKPKAKRKRRPKIPNGKPHILHQRTVRHASWSYSHLQHVTLVNSNTTSQPNSLDNLSVQLSLTSSLQQFLGLHGTAMRFDILKIHGQEVWIRIDAADRQAFVAAVGGSRGRTGEGWRIKGWSSWDAGGGNRSGWEDLFGD